MVALFFLFFPSIAKELFLFQSILKSIQKMLAVLAKVRTLRQHEEQRSRSKMEKEQNVIQR